MRRNERAAAQAVIDDISAWVEQAAQILSHREAVRDRAELASRAFGSRIFDVSVRGSRRWRVLPLRATDAEALEAIARRTRLPLLDETSASILTRLGTDVARSLELAGPGVSTWRVFRSRSVRESAQTALEFLQDFHGWAGEARLAETLAGLDARTASVERPALRDALSADVGFSSEIPDAENASIIDASKLSSLTPSVSLIEETLAREKRDRQAAFDAGLALRRAETNAMVANMPVEKLKATTRQRLRIQPLTDAGLKTVMDVIENEYMLSDLDGIGDKTAYRLWGAAQTIWNATFEEMPVRVDVSKRTGEAGTLLRALAAWDATRTMRNATADLARVEALAPLSRSLDVGVVELVVFEVAATAEDLIADVRKLAERAEILRLASDQTGGDPWADFLERPADYFTMLSELGFLLEDQKAVEGDLPDEVIEKVRRFELSTELLTVSLRGYQAFGAKFALVQRKVIIGDEMGLGKTIEALAVIAHISQKGATHSLVVCPAAVVTNWVREVQAKSSLRAHRLHGPAREQSLKAWVRLGGVAVTTFESLGWFHGSATGVGEVGCVVVDEAHYIKNPDALRSWRTSKLINAADHAVLLTGTPLENRLEEFRTLVRYVRPNLVVDAHEFLPRQFRQQVAPVYLRRNQEDVLTELPELVEVDEWLPLSRSDERRYREAVGSGNFAAMRQAAMVTGQDSTKLGRLCEIVEEAEDNGRKVIVFSHFLDVLGVVRDALPGKVFGPLTGSVPAVKRQQLVDEFSAAKGGAVLVSQIIAGGVGLNIQAASVVIITEPQLKPTTEWQAIARARRMGQLESVQVHRLLSEVGVDKRVTEILERKRALFAEFAAVSETADLAPEALDVSEAELVREVVAAERERLFGSLSAREPLPPADEAEAI